MSRWHPLEGAGLRAGDRLVQVGRADLRGVGTLGLMVRVAEQAEGGRRSLPLVFERDGQRRTTSLDVVPVSVYLPALLASFGVAVSVLFLFLRARPTPSVRAFFYTGMCLAIGAATQNVALGLALPGRLLGAWLSIGIGMVALGLVAPLLIHFLFLFPDDVAPEGRWPRIWPWLFAPAMTLSLALFGSGWIGVGEMGLFLTAALGALAAGAVVTRKYRRCGPVARRQMKWFLFGMYCALLPTAFAGVLAALDPRVGWLAYFSSAFIPLSAFAVLVSVARFNLFDIDRILSAAASYNILAVLLGAGALILVPRIAEAASGAAGVDPGTGQVVLSLALAAVVIPAHRRLRPQIDRVFFKERYALDHGIAELLPTLSQCGDARSLTTQVGEGLNALLRPESCVVYALVEESYVPVFAEGRAVPPAFHAASPLVGTLGERRKPLALGDAGRRPDEAPLDAFDRAALETLQAQVVVPVRRDALAAFICLGPKRSGDVYTSSDVAQLASVAETVSLQLQRFDQEELLREGRQMQESLRRYVPGAIAEQLSSGSELVSGEREVSVLFVDIRGYTSFAESRKAEEIFSTVNRYTETVSQIVQKHAGAVVEFNGDGMMAVFGAPRELAHKERAAVEAGREIVAAVSALPIEEGEQGREAAAQRGEAERSHQDGLTVGVGIATGTAFVGNIQAVDRMIWSAIGNTTNLAARLQSLTRELGASVVIDARTWERAESAAADFAKKPALPIRGRRESRDVYALPMESGS